MVTTSRQPPASRRSRPIAAAFAPPALAALAALTAAPSLAAPPSPPPRPLAASLSLEASSAEGVEGSSLITAVGAELRLRARWPFELAPGEFLSGEPFFGAAAAFPYVRCGAVRPSGLAAFVYGPAAASPSLIDGDGAPLALAWPSRTGYRGASLGDAFGIFAAAPAIGNGLPDVERAALGAWLSPRGGYPSLLAMAIDAPPSLGGPLWYDAPDPPSSRVLAAASASAAGKGWAVGAAAAGSLAFPGRDAQAARVEARAGLGPLRAEATASVTSEGWLSPDGKGAPFLRVSADLRYYRRGYAASIGYRLVREGAAGLGEGRSGAASDPSELADLEAEIGLSRFSGSAEGVGRLGSARVAASLAPAYDDKAVTFELDVRVRPGFAPWLSVRSSWRASGGAAERFDVLSQLALGKRARVTADAGVRFVPSGPLCKGALSLSRPSRRLGLRASVSTPGWIEPAANWYESLEYSVGASVPLTR